MDAGVHEELFVGGHKMFEVFGEFDSAEEINKAAAAQLAQGDTQAVRDIAKENGLDPADAEDYITGDVTELCNPLMAALGKLKIERADLELKGVLEDWYDIVTDMCVNDEAVRAAVRRKDKSLKVFMSLILAKAFDTKELVSSKIVKITKVKNGKEQMRSPVYLGIPNRAEIRNICNDYYLK